MKLEMSAKYLLEGYAEINKKGLLIASQYIQSGEQIG